MEKTLNYHITVYGRVQGVGYRYWVVKTANELAINGYVKNNIDGTVFIEAEGNESELSKFVSLCNIGPGWSHVERVVSSAYPTRGFNEFRIKY